MDMKMIWLDETGFPVEHYLSRPFLNWLRDHIHGRKRVCERCWLRERQEKLASEQHGYSDCSKR